MRFLSDLSLKNLKTKENRIIFNLLVSEIYFFTLVLCIRVCLLSLYYSISLLCWLKTDRGAEMFLKATVLELKI